MIFLRNHTFNTFVTTILLEARLLKRDEKDNHAMLASMKYTLKDGMWMEFGVYNGITLRLMANYRPRKMIYAFDSFQGLPERWRNVNYDKSLEKYVKKGAFDRNGMPPSMKQKNIAFVIGLFNQTLPIFLKENKKKTVSFLHVDSDIYSSSYYILNALKTRFVDGTIVVFDELVNYPEFKLGELKALWDVFHLEDFTIKVIAHSCNEIDSKPTIDKWPQAVALKFIRN